MSHVLEEGLVMGVLSASVSLAVTLLRANDAITTRATSVTDTPMQMQTGLSTTT